MTDRPITITEGSLRKLYADATRLAFDQALLRLQQQKDMLEKGGVENGAYWVGLALEKFVEVYREIEKDPVGALWTFHLAETMETLRAASDAGWTA